MKEEEKKNTEERREEINSPKFNFFFCSNENYIIPNETNVISSSMIAHNGRFRAVVSVPFIIFTFIWNKMSFENSLNVRSSAFFCCVALLFCFIALSMLDHQTLAMFVRIRREKGKMEKKWFNDGIREEAERIKGMNKQNQQKKIISIYSVQIKTKKIDA